MDDARETPGGEALELTPAERRVLRRFFRRHALPYLAGAVLLCGAVLLTRGGPAPSSAEDPTLHRVQSALEETVKELEAARDRLQRIERSTEQNARSAEALHRRVDSALQRVDQVEGEAQERQKRVMDRIARFANRSSPAAPSDDGALVERLDSIETRLFYLERGSAGRDSHPGAPAPPD
jgi:DNA repair exonuclease SbcCD ATPase subunit